MKVGDLVRRKVEPWEQLSPHFAGHDLDLGIGVVTWWDGCGKYKVLWSKRIRPAHHDDWELVLHESW